MAMRINKVHNHLVFRLYRSAFNQRKKNTLLSRTKNKLTRRLPELKKYFFTSKDNHVLLNESTFSLNRL